MNEDMGRQTSQGSKIYVLGKSELRHAIANKVKLNGTGYMLTLIGAVHGTGGYCLVFSGSKIAALIMPKHETTD